VPIRVIDGHFAAAENIARLVLNIARKLQK
jgi:hypothetical protein